MTQTSVIETALQRLLADLGDNAGTLDDLIAGLQADIGRHGHLSTDDLYDEAGLPR
jgi:hypothetical protein